MTRVDFYVTGADGALARERFACRLAGKAMKLGHRLHIHVADEAALKRMDELLWTFSDASFLPHARLGTDDDAAITLDSQSAPEPTPELLINLATDIPGFFSRFARVAEIVAGGDGEREAGRKRFRFYRDRGYPLQHHRLQV